MSLRRRIAAAAAFAVAAVAIAVALTGYFTTRSHLRDEVKASLVALARPELGPHDRRQDLHQNGEQGADQHQGGDCTPNGSARNFPAPPAQPFGGAQGYFQQVCPNGRVLPEGTVRLPLTPQVGDIARRRLGSVFYDTHVNHTHIEVYAAWDAPDHHVVMAALPLTDDDAVLSGLLLPYGLLIGGGILLAALLGLAISRSALRPIERFVARTESVTAELEHPARLEETDAIELRRLAASFNQTLDALERSIEAQRHLVADASHELRTPMAALRSNIQIFLEAERLPVREREELQQSILAELDELTQIVADVVELARGSRPSLRVEQVELDTIVREAVDRAQRRAPNLRFELELEPTVVEGVPERIARAVANVIDNSRKWSPPDGTVEVRLQAGTLTVRDHGPGFTEKDLPHVFDRFYRAHEARRMPGSGLGLAIVKQAAEAHGGRVEATNAPDGGGIVTLSFGAPVAIAADTTASAYPPPVAAKGRVSGS
jgi:two-component system, OmpR family, sensor histidine kinase MprB